MFLFLVLLLAYACVLSHNCEQGKTVLPWHQVPTIQPTTKLMMTRPGGNTEVH